MSSDSTGLEKGQRPVVREETMWFIQSSERTAVRQNSTVGLHLSNNASHTHTLSLSPMLTEKKNSLLLRSEITFQGGGGRAYYCKKIKIKSNVHSSQQTLQE